MAHMMISTRRWKSLDMYIHSINYRYIYVPRKSLSKQIRYKNVSLSFLFRPLYMLLILRFYKKVPYKLSNPSPDQPY